VYTPPALQGVQHARRRSTRRAWGCRQRSGQESNLLRFECGQSRLGLAQRFRRARRRGWTCFSGCVCVGVLMQAAGVFGRLPRKWSRRLVAARPGRSAVPLACSPSLPRSPPSPPSFAHSPSFCPPSLSDSLSLCPTHPRLPGAQAGSGDDDDFQADTKRGRGQGGTCSGSKKESRGGGKAGGQGQGGGGGGSGGDVAVRLSKNTGDRFILPHKTTHIFLALQPSGAWVASLDSTPGVSGELLVTVTTASVEQPRPLFSAHATYPRGIET
jgi:hypothetical protein